MRAVFESTFDVVYLVSVCFMGLYMIARSRDKNTRLFGIMAVILGVGDSFHLVPRIVALLSGQGFEPYAAYLGMGKFITSITMTIFYIILYYVYRNRYSVREQNGVRYALYALALCRIALCLIPANNWLSSNPPLMWAVVRNIPFSIMGILIIVLFYRAQKTHGDSAYRFMWLTIVLSFAFYLPVVLWGHLNENIGLLMIPKTLSYVWTIWIGFCDFKREVGRVA